MTIVHITVQRRTVQTVVHHIDVPDDATFICSGDDVEELIADSYVHGWAHVVELAEDPPSRDDDVVLDIVWDRLVEDRPTGEYL